MNKFSTLARGLLGTTAAFALSLPASAQTTDAATTSVEDVVVTGSFLRSEGFKPSSPVDVLPSAELLTRAPQNLASFLNSIPYIAAPPGQAGPTLGLQGGTLGQLNLRSLGAGATLVLVDSQRVAPYPFNDFFADTNAIVPQVMIRNVEVLKDGASALYGSDAVAGVVNILTRTDFSGFELSAQANARLPSAEGNYKFSAIFGSDVGSKTHLVFAAQYEEQDIAFWDTVNAFTENDAFQLGKVAGLLGTPGNPGAFTTPRRDANGRLTSTLAKTTIDPYCGIASDSLITGSGATRTCSYYFPSDQSFLAYDRRYHIFAAARHDFNENLWTKFQANYSNDFDLQSQSVNVPLGVAITVPYTNPGVTSQFLTPAVNAGGQQLYAVPDPKNPSLPLRDANYQVVLSATPTNPASGVPFFEDLGFLGRPFGSQGGLPTQGALKSGEYARSKLAPTQRDYFRSSVQFGGKLLADWSWAANATYSVSNDAITAVNNTAPVELQNAIRGFGGANCNPATGVAGQGQCLYFNPFGNAVYSAPGSAAANSQAVLDYINPRLTDRYKSSVGTVDVVLSGDLFDLPAGPLAVAVGAQVRRDKWQVEYDSHKVSGNIDNGVPSINAGGVRDTTAEFIQFGVPVFENSVGRLNLDAAVRHEDSGGSLQTTTPKVGGLFTMLDDKLAFRGSWAKSFLAPTLLQENATIVANSFLSDPLLNNIMTRTVSVTRGNKNLKPQTSTVYSAGIVARPIDNLKLDVGYFHYEFEDLLATQSAQVIINADPRDPAITRDPVTGLLQSIVLTNFNAASLVTAGFDLGGDYSFALGRFGELKLRTLWTHVPTYDFQPLAGSPVKDLSGNYNNTQPTNVFPSYKWRGGGGATWSWGPGEAAVNVTYVGSIKNDRAVSATAADATIPSWTAVDLSYSYQFSRKGFPPVIAAVGLQNAFDSTPPTIAFFNTIVSGPYDYRGRMGWVRLTTNF